MNHPAYIALVDAHSEGDSGTYHINLVHLETLLHRCTLHAGESRMVGLSIDTVVLQRLSHHLRVLAGQAVDDARIALTALDEAVDELQLLLLRALLTDGETEVRTVEAADERLTVEMQLLDDVLARNLIGCSRERHHRDIAEILVEQTQLGVLRTEIMTPLADAVSLIYGKERYLDVAEEKRNLADQLLG